jgi:predicted ArsR family transcriptional regulator
MPHRETGVGAPVDLLASPVRRALVDTLATAGQLDPEHPGMMAADVAAAHGLHVTTARFHLDQLVAAGILQAHFERPARAGRPRKLYSVSPGTWGSSTASDTAAYKALAELLAATFARAASGSITPADAGREWARQHVPPDASGPARSPGQWLSKLGRLVDVLRGWGYTPQIATSDDGREVSVSLVDCPFLDLARDNPAVVCGIHRGLIAGTMTQLGEDRTEVSLEPFVAPNRCLAHVRTTTAFAQPPRPDPPRRAA